MSRWAGKVHIYFKDNVDKLVSIISKDPCVQAIILFGSVANGKCTPYSDIDICVLHTCAQAEFMPVNISDYYSSKDLVHSAEVDMLSFNIDYFNGKDNALINNIRKGVLVWKKN